VPVEHDELRQRVIDEIKRRQDAGETLTQIAASVGAHWNTAWHWGRGKKIGTKALTLLLLKSAPVEHQAA